jgi:hypothetical protein
LPRLARRNHINRHANGRFLRGANMKRKVKTVENFNNAQKIILDCGHHYVLRNSAKWFKGDDYHCGQCLEAVTQVEPEQIPLPKPFKTYRIRATEILPFHQIGKREPLVRYYLEGNIKGGMKFADKRDAQDIVDALDHEQLTAVTFLIKFRHEVVEATNEQT